MILFVCTFSYRNLATEHETLMQKYLHLLQIVETEKTVAKQLRQQIEDGEIEIERLKSEVRLIWSAVTGNGHAMVNKCKLLWYDTTPFSVLHKTEYFTDVLSNWVVLS